MNWIEEKEGLFHYFLIGFFFYPFLSSINSNISWHDINDSIDSIDSIDPIGSYIVLYLFYFFLFHLLAIIDDEKFSNLMTRNETIVGLLLSFSRQLFFSLSARVCFISHHDVIFFYRISSIWPRKKCSQAFIFYFHRFYV